MSEKKQLIHLGSDKSLQCGSRECSHEHFMFEPTFELEKL